MLSPDWDPKAWLEEQAKRPRSPEYERLLQEVVAAKEERDRAYAAASPEERARMDREAIEAGVRFIMDESFGGP